MALSDIVEIVVNINQSTIAQAGFSVPLIYAPHVLPNRVYTFKSATWSTDMVAEGFANTSVAYQVARQMMSQTPRPSTFKVGKATTAETAVTRITPVDTAVGTNYRFTLTNGVAADVTATFVQTTATVAAAATGIAGVLNGLLGVTAVSDATGVTVTSPAGTRVGFASSTGVSLADATTASGTVSADLTAIQAEDDDWYALVLASKSAGTIYAAAQWIEAQHKIMVTDTADPRMLAGVQVGQEDVAERIRAAGFARTHVPYHSRSHQHYGASWTGAMMVYEPGQADWRFKQLRGVDTDRLTGSQENQLKARRSSYYERILGRASTGAARGGDGTFIDLTQLSDWLRARVTEAIVALLTSAPKLAFTDQAAGVGIWNALDSVVRQAISNGAVDENPESYEIFVPKRSDLTAQDRTDRVWRGCVLTVTPTSSVHSVGVITINLNVAG